MAKERGSDYWYRKEHFEKYGTWPTYIPKKKAHPVVSEQIAQHAEPVEPVEQPTLFDDPTPQPKSTYYWNH